MKKKPILCLVVVMILLAASSGFSQEKLRPRDLAEKYQDFLDLTKYIMLDVERDVFLRLGSDRDRDSFIRTFWKQRDPTPGTPQNEYKTEHIRRFDYATKQYGRQGIRDGWRTDQGMIYIILGEPASKERFYGTLELYNCEVWYYYGDTNKGTPPHFALTFFQRGNAGPYKLYDPVSDGPAALMLHGHNYHPTDFEGMVERIRELAPTLSLVVLSIIPGDVPFNYRPSPQTTIRMAEIIQSPMRNVNPKYATHFLDYKGVVSTEYMENFKNSKVNYAIIKDPLLDIDFLHFTMAPEEISVDFYEPKDQYFCNFSLTVSLRVGEDIIFQYSREFPFYFPEDDIGRIQNSGIAIEDSFPLIPGEYKMIILLQNSVGKEFSIFEQDLNIAADSGAPRLTDPVLGYGIEAYQRNLHIPYKILDKKLVVDPDSTFGALDDISFMVNLLNVDQDLWQAGKLRIEVQGLKPVDPASKALELNLNTIPYKRTLAIDQTLPGQELPPDYYKMNLTLLDGSGQILDSQTSEFVISTQAAVAHPIAHSKALPMAQSYRFYYMLAGQHEEIGEFDRAEAAYKRAFSANPGFMRGVADYGRFLIKAKKFDESLEMAENLKDSEDFRFQYRLIRGKALMGKERYLEAAEELVEGNKIYNSDADLLNSLGFCFYKLGENERAVNALKASLKLNPDQDNVKALLAEVEKK